MVDSSIVLRKEGRRTKFYFSYDEKIHMLGAFNNIEKFKRFDYDLNGHHKIKSVVSIIATKEDMRGNQKKEFDLDAGVYTSIGEWIKTPGRMPGFGLETIDEAYYKLEEYIIDNLDMKEKHIVPAYGIFGEKGTLYYPGKYEVENIDLEKNVELKSFVNIFNKKEIDEIKLKKTIEILYNYLKEDETNLFVFAYGYITLYRHYLFSKFGLEDFPLLGLMSSGTNKGKSARIRVLINGAFLNWTSKSFHSSDIFKGSDERFFELNKVNAPIGIEELENLSSDKAAFLKQLATSSEIQNRIANIGGQGTYTRNFFRGGIVITANEMNEIPSSLRDRFIIKDLSDHKVSANIEKYYNNLKRNIGIVSQYIWANVEKDISIIKIKSESREKSYLNVFENGINLVNNLFSKFDLKPLEFDVKGFIENKDDLILTNKIKKKREIISYIKKFSMYVDKDGYIKKSIFDMQSLMRHNRKNKHIINKILNEAWDAGIVCGEEGILITKTFLDKMNSESNSFFNIKNVRNLTEYFKEGETQSYRTGDNADLNYYDNYYYCDGVAAKKTKTGLMLIKVWKEEDKIDWED